MFTPVAVGVDVVVVVLVVVLVRVVVLAVVWFNSELVVKESAGDVVLVVVVVLASNVVLVNRVDEELVLVSKVDGLVVEDVVGSREVLVNNVDREVVVDGVVEGSNREDEVVKFALADDVVKSETGVDEEVSAVVVKITARDVVEDVCSVFELVLDSNGVVKADELVVRLGTLDVVVVLKLSRGVVVVVVVCSVVRLSCLVVEVTMNGRELEVKTVDVVAGVE
jgi:hypothetical protein